MGILLGAIADDFTGATDLANTLVRAGMPTTQVIGIPEKDTDIGDARAVVIALKSRTAPVDEAVMQSLQALAWLQEKGVRQVFFKYCSTFDSTDQGNIGPVADALVNALAAPISVVCPAFPTNGRTIRDGNLYVGDQLLEESSMKDHPLTPMRDSRLPALMTRQSEFSCGLVPENIIKSGGHEIRAELKSLADKGYRYAVTDAVDDADLLFIGQAIADHPLVTGGSGIALGLPANLLNSDEMLSADNVPLPVRGGRKLVIAGSCSQATRNQLDNMPSEWSRFAINPVDVLEGRLNPEEVVDWSLAQDPEYPVTLYSSANPEDVARIQERFGREQSGESIERLFGQVAMGLVERGFDKLIVAGGETSGAVVSALGITALKISREIDPGVPWTEAVGTSGCALALKSGNFGGPDFFAKAFAMLP